MKKLAAAQQPTAAGTIVSSVRFAAAGAVDDSLKPSRAES